MNLYDSSIDTALHTIQLTDPILYMTIVIFWTTTTLYGIAAVGKALFGYHGDKPSEEEKELYHTWKRLHLREQKREQK